MAMSSADSKHGSHCSCLVHFRNILCIPYLDSQQGLVSLKDSWKREETYGQMLKNMISLVRPSTHLLTPQQHRNLLVLVEQHAWWIHWRILKLASNGDAHWVFWVLLPNIKNIRNNHSWMRTVYPSPPIYHLLRVGECHFKLKTGNPSNTPHSLMVKLCYIMASPKCSLVKNPRVWCLNLRLWWFKLEFHSNTFKSSKTCSKSGDIWCLQ